MVDTEGSHTGGMIGSDLEKDPQCAGPLGRTGQTQVGTLVSLEPPPEGRCPPRYGVPPRLAPQAAWMERAWATASRQGLLVNGTRATRAGSFFRSFHSERYNI